MTTTDALLSTDLPDPLLLTDLPDDVFSRIFSYLSYDEISKNRQVCKRFNETGWYLLNRGFVAAEKYQSAALKAVKTQLPRRESERRKHPLSKKCDVLVAIETRLSMLSMAFSRFIESKLCCFIPGKVIDELFRVMKSLDAYTECQPPHQILQELRDVSTMAIEHFDEKIAPILRDRELESLTSHRVVNFFEIPAGINSSQNDLYDFSSLSHIYPRHSVLKTVSESLTRIKKLERMQKQFKVPCSLRELVRKQKRTIKELRTMVNEQVARLSHNEAVTNDLKHQVDELKTRLSQKFAPISHIGDELPSSSGITTGTAYVNDDALEPAIKKRKEIEN